MYRVKHSTDCIAVAWCKSPDVQGRDRVAIVWMMYRNVQVSQDYTMEGCGTPAGMSVLELRREHTVESREQNRSHGRRIEYISVARARGRADRVAVATV